jgi:hypothetical protein
MDDSDILLSLLTVLMVFMEASSAQVGMVSPS